LRLKLNIRPKNYDYKSTVVVVKKNYNFIGLIVDDVIDYITISIDKENFSNDGISTKETNYFIEGIIKENKTIIKLLNIDNILYLD
jgi:chemotaxis signal transduction protein